MLKTTISIILLAICGLCITTSGVAQGSIDPVVAPAPDYSNSADWVCRPGKEETCETKLDTKVIFADGSTTVEPFVPAVDPPIDCFYVYPTVSQEPTDFANLVDGPAIRKVTREQVGRLTSKCRVFAPIYRQTTLAYLKKEAEKQTVPVPTFPVSDIDAAWQYYWEHDNRGPHGRRGVVIIGHSQGTLILQGLIAGTIDPDPLMRAQLVAAFLAGDPSLGVPAGALVGGTFAHIPLCTAGSQTGCVYAWGSYLGTEAKDPTFGRVRIKDELTSACDNPAAPGGGIATLKFIYPKAEGSPDTDPPFIEAIRQVSGSCEPVSADARANVFEVNALDTPEQPILNPLLQHYDLGPKVGLHEIDIPLVQGNILDVLDQEIAAWEEAHRAH